MRGESEAWRRPGAPNVLPLILDTLRVRSLGLYDGPVANTPVLTRLARRGVVFDDAYATASWTFPSHASIFTGEYASRTGADWLTPLPNGSRTLAELFAGNGYATGGFVANTVVIITSDHGESLGAHGVFGHGNALYRNQIRVPLLIIVNAPGLPAGTRVSHPVSLRDLAASVLDFADITPNAAWNGRSLRTIAMSGDPTGLSPVIAEVSRGIKVDPGAFADTPIKKSVVDDTIQIIETDIGTLSAFGFTDDPLETVDLSAQAQRRRAGLALIERVLLSERISWPDRNHPD